MGRLGLALVLGVLLATTPLRAVAAEQSFTEALDAVLESAASAASPSIVAMEVKRKGPVAPRTPAVSMLAFVRGTGPVTGVILSSDGYVLTSLFNVEGDLESIKVTMPDGSVKDAKLLGKDRSRNIALLKVDAQNLPVLKIVRANEVLVGQWVLALGRSFPGRAANVSLGIVSATNRIAGRAIQTDADVGPANYGGALVDLEGRLVAILTPVGIGGAEADVVNLHDSGIGFAIPVTDVLAELDRLKAGEEIKPPLLGIVFDSTAMKGGAVVEQIMPNSGAAKSGLQIKDIIIEFDGKPIDSSFQLLHAIGSHATGDVVKFKVKRGDQTIELTVTLGARTE